jgi:hypothetical protein
MPIVAQLAAQMSADWGSRPGRSKSRDKPGLSCPVFQASCAVRRRKSFVALVQTAACLRLEDAGQGRSGFFRVVFQSLRRRARDHGIPRGQCGAVTFVQRFGSALNLHVHAHTIVLDGVYAALEGEVRILTTNYSAPFDQRIRLKGHAPETCTSCTSVATSAAPTVNTKPIPQVQSNAFCDWAISRDLAELVLPPVSE